LGGATDIKFGEKISQ